MSNTVVKTKIQKVHELIQSRKFINETVFLYVKESGVSSSNIVIDSKLDQDKVILTYSKGGTLVLEDRLISSFIEQPSKHGEKSIYHLDCLLKQGVIGKKEYILI